MPRRFLKADRSAAISAFALAAIGFGAALCVGAAPVAAAVPGTYSFQLTGDPAGNQIDYEPCNTGGILAANVQAGDVEATIGGVDVIMHASNFTPIAPPPPPSAAASTPRPCTVMAIWRPYGNSTIYDASFNPLGSGSLSSGVIYATPDGSAAAIVLLDVTNYSGVGAASGLPSGYLAPNRVRPKTRSRW